MKNSNVISSTIVTLSDGSIRIEEKVCRTIVLEDKLYGQLADQKNQNLELTLAEAARRYIMDDRGADDVLFPLPVIVRGASRNGAGNGRVYIGLFRRDQLAKALADKLAGKANALKLDGTVKISKAEKMAMIQTFGQPENLIPTELTSLTGIEAQFLAKGAKFSTRGRAWETVVQETLKARGLKIRYIGSLRAGKHDLQQRGDHVVETDIPARFW